MKQLIVLLLILVACLYAYAPVNFKELPQPTSDYQFKNWWNWEQARRILLEMRAYDDSHYVQWGEETVNASGYDTVFLDDKYIDSTNWNLTATPIGIATAMSISIAKLSDSSCAVICSEADSSYYWQAVGIKKPERD